MTMLVVAVGVTPASLAMTLPINPVAVLVSIGVTVPITVHSASVGVMVPVSAMIRRHNTSR
jgi:hypothetical protein